MRLSYCCCIFNHLFMATVSVTNMLIKEALFTRIRILFFENGGFFLSEFCLWFPHKRRFCAKYTLVLRLVHTYRDVFGKWKHLREAY